VPFVITKRKIPVFTVTPITTNNVVTSKLKRIVAKPNIKSIIEDKELKKCPHGVILGIGFCNKGCKM